MNTGDRIKKARNLRKMTQKELGIEMKYPGSSADVRIAQYESGTRGVKSEIIEQIAEVLKVSPDYLIGPQGYSDADVMRMFFELEDAGYAIDIIKREGHTIVDITADKLKVPLEEWRRVKTRLRKEKISESEYIEWKLCWSE